MSFFFSKLLSICGLDKILSTQFQVMQNLTHFNNLFEIR